jgi:SAM-dependent methyltransferase
VPFIGQPGKDVSWVTTPDALVERMLDMARVTPDDHLLDLGSGDGRLVIAAARRGVRSLGVEYDATLVALASRRAQTDGLERNASFVKQDLFESDLSHATVITMFLLPELNLKLRPKLLSLAPGTRIVSNTFTMDDWDPDETVTLSEGCLSWCTALMWIVPARIAGVWRSGTDNFRIDQDFQRIRVRQGRRSATDAVLRGASIRFRFAGREYDGHIDGDTIAGTVRSNDRAKGWTARRVFTQNLQ